jgi:hypothetical protein
MKKIVTMIAGTVLLSALLASAQESVKPGTVQSASVAVQAQANCPVMGGAINKELFVEQDGVRIYTCCKGCIAPLKKDFATYRAKLEKEGVTLETVKPVLEKKP